MKYKLSLYQEWGIPQNPPIKTGEFYIYKAISREYYKFKLED